MFFCCIDIFRDLWYYRGLIEGVFMINTGKIKALIEKDIDDYIRNRKFLISRRDHSNEKATYVNGEMTIKPMEVN